MRLKMMVLLKITYHPNCEHLLGVHNFGCIKLSVSIIISIELPLTLLKVTEKNRPGQR